MYSIGFVVTISVSLVILDFIAFPIELKIAFPSTVPSSVVTLDFPVTISKDIFCDGITAITLSILVPNLFSANLTHFFIELVIPTKFTIKPCLTPLVLTEVEHKILYLPL